MSGLRELIRLNKLQNYHRLLQDEIRGLTKGCDVLSHSGFGGPHPSDNSVLPKSERICKK